MEISVQLFDKICRVCLVQSANLKSLLTKTEGDNRNLLQVLAFTANIDIKIEDSLPKQVCNACETIMCKADEFKRRCHASEIILNNVYQNNALVTESSKYVHNFSAGIKEKLSEYGTLVSPISTNNTLNDEFDTKNTLLQGFPITSKTDINNFPVLPEKFEQLVKKENNIDDENDFMDDFDDGGQFQDIPFDDHEKVDKKPKSKSKKIGLRYECLCHIQFLSKDKYKTHLKEKQCDAYTKLKSNKGKIIQNKIDCANCKTMFATPGEWKSHMEKCKTVAGNEKTRCRKTVAGNEKTKWYQCSFCLRKCKNKISLSAHIQRHKETDNIKHVCEVCKREFKYKAYLEKHVLTAHSKTNGLSCDICVQSFLNKAALETHKKSHDSDNSDKKHRCTVCSKAFKMLCTLKEHMRTHTGEKPFLCSQCGKGFSQKTNLAEHTRRHQGLKLFKCESCEKRFVSKGELDAHTRKHSGAHPFVCDDCGNGFTTSSALIKHRRTHTGERPYQCDLCPMRFAASGTLTNHRRTHTGERPFQCSYCEKAFVQRNDLISHIRCHTGERPYICTQCGQSFRKASGLKAHVKLHIKDPVVGVNALLTAMHCPEQ